MEKYKFDLDSMATLSQGEVAPVFRSGGATQIKFTTSLEWYEELGLIKEI